MFDAAIQILRPLPAIGLAILLCSCASSAVSNGVDPALDGTDLQRMTDDMAMQMMACPAVQQAIARQAPLCIVVQPVENRMTAEVLPRLAADAFTARLRFLLARQAPDKFTWIMNRDAFYALHDSQIDLGPPPDRIQPDYALTARFSSVASEDLQKRQTYYVCVYQLTDLHSSAVLWTGKYEVSKTAVKGFLD